MIKSAIEAFTEFLKRPGLIIAPLAATAIMLGILWLSMDYVMPPIFEVLVGEQLSGVGIIEAPFYFLQFYPMQSLVLALILLISFGLQIGVLLAFGESLKTKKVTESITKAAKKAKEIAYLVIFLALIALIYFILLLALFWLNINLTGIAATIALLITALWLLAGFYLYIKIWLLPAVIAVKKLNIKKGLKECWTFSEKHFFGIIGVMVIASLATYGISGIGDLVSNFFLDESIEALVYLLFVVAATGYSNMLVVKYYANKALKK